MKCFWFDCYIIVCVGMEGCSVLLLINSVFKTLPSVADVSLQKNAVSPS